MERWLFVSFERMSVRPDTGVSFDPHVSRDVSYLDVVGRPTHCIRTVGGTSRFLSVTRSLV